MKARNAKLLSARCVSVRVRVYACEKQPSVASVELERDFPLKREKKNTKQDSIREKVHKFFLIVLFLREIPIIYLLKLRLFEIKLLSLRLIKHDLPFILATRWRPYSANLWAFSPCSDANAL